MGFSHMTNVSEWQQLPGLVLGRTVKSFEVSGEGKCVEPKRLPGLGCVWLGSLCVCCFSFSVLAP